MLASRIVSVSRTLVRPGGGLPLRRQCLSSTIRLSAQQRSFAIQFDPQHAAILQLDIKAKFARDTIAAMRGHDRSSMEAIRILKSNIAEWERKNEREAKDADIVVIMIELAMTEFVASLTDSNKSESFYGTERLVTDYDRILRAIKRYLPRAIPRDELEDEIQKCLSEMPNPLPTDRVELSRAVVFALGGRALPREVDAVLQKAKK